MPLVFEENCGGMDDAVDSGVAVSSEEMKGLFPVAAVL